jgi:hypothetical protein
MSLGNMHEDTAVVKRGRCLEAYMLLTEWPPKLPPLVRACNKHVNEAFKVLRGFGRYMVISDGGRQYEAVFFATWDYKPVSMWLVSTYAMPPSPGLLREFLTHLPATLSALFDDLVKMGRSVEGGVVIPPRLYLRVALVVRSIAGLFFTL